MPRREKSRELSLLEIERKHAQTVAATENEKRIADELANKNKETQEFINKKREQLKSLSEEVASSKELLKEIVSKIKSADISKNEVMTNLSLVIKELDDAKKQSKDVISEAEKEAKEIISNAEKNVSSEIALYRAKQQQLLEIKNEISQKESYLSDMNVLISSKAEKNSRLEEDLHRTTNNLLKISEDVNREDDNLKSLISKIETKKIELEKIENNISISSNQLNAVNNEIKDSVEELESVNSAIEKTEKDLEVARINTIKSQKFEEELKQKEKELRDKCKKANVKYENL